MSVSGIMGDHVSLDLETTGLYPSRDKIIEIGAVKVIGGKETESFSTLVNPGRKLEERIVELTGIRDDDLKNAPYIEDVLGQILEFIGELPLLGHSVLFDYSFMKKAAVDRKLSFEKNGVDTLKIARRYLPELEHRSLGYLCGYYKIEHQAHRALNDARATEELFLRLTEDFYDADSSGSALFRPQPLTAHVKRDIPASRHRKEQLYRLMTQHKITLDVDVERLSRSEADRLIDKILSNALLSTSC